MSFNRLDPTDFVVSSDSITATLWTGAVPTLSSFFTSSVQEAGSSGDYYLNVFQANPITSTTASIQFAIAYGNSAGSGSALYNSAVLTYRSSTSSSLPCSQPNPKERTCSTSGLFFVLIEVATTI